ncbi:DUF4038 domain-containing protein [Alteromonas pelagimontana]|uniref:DUF4038 domain-containing protein n=1 Tax=Alteromonas pelagimontana TaxID=1858656 RepID=A0A6M4MBX0_9ALTE|nr:glycoside hydrolase family 140 protein [Alteromonas pelagimontana]QJR80704.1 DUF4038 domain-containing protein [Alteromonas pelagimontana]
MPGKVKLLVLLSLIGTLLSCATQKDPQALWPNIVVGKNPHYFAKENGQQFFWLADTAWLMFKKLDRKDTLEYLQNRQAKGFNVIQVMLLHSLDVTNFQGDAALIGNNITKPLITKGNNPASATEYDYWDHVEFAIDAAADQGLWVALVPVWGSEITPGKVSKSAITQYATFLAKRFGNKPNIIWMNGGDTLGNENTEIWEAMGSTLNKLDSRHLITFHPRGRHMSSEWFHNRPWLDFNMFQSGHRSYGQDTSWNSFRYGPDNWRYAQKDYARKPLKPTLDGEPSYEDIPYGLHDSSLPRWKSEDVRRYAYWSVFHGAAGFTYGHNSVMQFYQPESGEAPVYGATQSWHEAMDAEGATQMAYLKTLILKHTQSDRRPDPDLVLNQGRRYDYQPALRGKDYALIYTFTGRPVTIDTKEIQSATVQARWFNPRDGKFYPAFAFYNDDNPVFNPPGGVQRGNDWVLVVQLPKKKKLFYP